MINREDKIVASRDVNLYVYGAGMWSEMRLRNDDDAWSAWQPFRNEVSWTLKDLNGERTVWVELRQGAQTQTTSDTIQFTGQSPEPPGSPLKIYLPTIIH